MKRGNSDVPWFQYKVTILFHLKLKMQDTLLTKLLRQFIELQKTQFFKTLENLRLETVLFFLSVPRFEKLRDNLTPESIYMKKECGLKKHTDKIYIYIYISALLLCFSESRTRSRNSTIVVPIFQNLSLFMSVFYCVSLKYF